MLTLNMGDDGSSQMGFQQHSAEMMLNCPSSGMYTRPMTMHSVYGSGWDPVVAFSMISQAELDKSSSYPASLESHGISSSPQLVNYPLDPNFAQFLPKVPMFGSGNFRDNPFGLPGVPHNPTGPLTQNHGSTKSMINEKPPPLSGQAERVCQVSEGRTAGVSPNSKRKRDSKPPAAKTTNTHKDNSSEISGPKDQDGNWQNTEQTTGKNSSGKQDGKQVNDNSQSDEGAKQNYIHVRARRGQATNSHSLAERVRREKISERMRQLQELVPGCNKITGKAVMLDEIINYVQSLQQQVEFLSMKLATVNPELTFDIERLLSKDILQSRGSSPPVTGFDQAMTSSHAFTQGIHQTLSSMPIAALQYHNMSRAVWDGDLQSLLQMGFDSSAAAGGLGPSGNSKNDL